MLRKIMVFLMLSFSCVQSVSVIHADEPSDPIIRFERKKFTVRRYHGMTYIDGVLTKHPTVDFPQYIALISFFDRLQLRTDDDVSKWVRKLRGVRTYTYDIVIRTDNKTVSTTTPLVLLASEERAHVDPLWNAWLAEQDELRRISEERRIAYESEQSRYTAQEEATKKLVAATQAAANSLAVASGETSLWEVELVPIGSDWSYGFTSSSRGATYFTGYYSDGISLGLGNGSLNTGETNRRYARVYGRSSDYAAADALAGNPGFRVGIIRKLAGY